MKIQNVPVPPSAIHLPRWEGIPVPLVTEWKATQPRRRHEQIQTIHGLTQSCTCLPGDGTPVFTEVCPARHRVAVTDRLCQFCGTQADGEMFFLGGPGTLVYGAAPMHRDCCRYSLTVCPGLTGAMARQPGRWVVAAAHSYQVLLGLRGHEEYVEVEQRGQYATLPATQWYTRPAVHRRIPAVDWLREGP